jgi:hypothetical protein
MLLGGFGVDWVARRDKRDASATGLRHALMLMSVTFVWASIHYYLAARTLRRDLQTRYIPPGGAIETAPAAPAKV